MVSPGPMVNHPSLGLAASPPHSPPPPTCVVISQESSQFAIWKQLAQFTASAASINVDGTINYREAGTDTEDAIMAAARAWGTEATLWKAAGGGGEGPVPLQY